jgi:hypothetical protein
LNLPSSTSAGRPESRICFLKRKYTDAVEAPCPPVQRENGSALEKGVLSSGAHDKGARIRANP